MVSNSIAFVIVFVFLIDKVCFMDHVKIYYDLFYFCCQGIQIIYIHWSTPADKISQSFPPETDVLLFHN